ncbi:BF3164 family lipoprotein [Longimicrobium sp.]|uniref:BF3164 family lipoprotein n=1 Tax=Longimicrobium sp. TaxID=2029185 RepID=UPI002E36FEF9|nr:BF3164 family lipoprotein [Longimicrobium sp.]HEX6040565.1 BF3164 family lipoprotein [Longimicrobium sp.]
MASSSRLIFLSCPSMRTATLAAFLLLASACSQTESRTEAKPLSGEVVTRGDFLGRPSSISVAGSRLVVTDASPPFLHVLAAADGAHLLSFGKNGAGPGEFREANEVLPDLGSDGSFWVFDSSLGRLSHFFMPEGASVPSMDQVINLQPGGPTLLLKAGWLTDSTIAATGIYPDGRIAVTDRTGRIVRYIGKRPPSTPGQNVPITVLQHAFTGPLTVAPDRQRLAMGTESADRLEIYRADGTLVRELRGASGFDPVFEVHSKPAGNTMAIGADHRFGYTGLASTDEHIYALYSGQVLSEGGAYAYFGTEIHVYTWDGDRVRTYRLDERARGITVTRDGRWLYAIQWVPEPRIVRYPLAA